MHDVIDRLTQAAPKASPDLIRLCALVVVSHDLDAINAVIGVLRDMQDEAVTTMTGLGKLALAVRFEQDEIKERQRHAA